MMSCRRSACSCPPQKYREEADERFFDIKVNDVTVGKSKVLCDNDLVSIRRCGRFRFLKARAQTKKNRLILQFERYL